MNGIHIGISGWRYAPWRGDFYPEGLLQRRELEYASRAVSSIEINGSFYALQTPERFAGWYAQTPDDFVFSVKAPRYITHVRRLREIALVVADTAGKWPLLEELTADFMYLRLHGDKELYASGYDEQALDQWEQRIRSWHQGRQPPDTRRISQRPEPSRKRRAGYCYFASALKVRAPYAARRLLEKLGLADHLQVRPGQLSAEFL